MKLIFILIVATSVVAQHLGTFDNVPKSRAELYDVRIPQQVMYPPDYDGNHVAYGSVFYDGTLSSKDKNVDYSEDELLIVSSGPRAGGVKRSVLIAVDTPHDPYLEKMSMDSWTASFTIANPSLGETASAVVSIKPAAVPSLDNCRPTWSCPCQADLKTTTSACIEEWDGGYTTNDQITTMIVDMQTEITFDLTPFARKGHRNFRLDIINPSGGVVKLYSSEYGTASARPQFTTVVKQRAQVDSYFNLCTTFNSTIPDLDDILIEQFICYPPGTGDVDIVIIPSSGVWCPLEFWAASAEKFAQEGITDGNGVNHRVVVWGYLNVGLGKAPLPNATDFSYTIDHTVSPSGLPGYADVIIAMLRHIDASYPDAKKAYLTFDTASMHFYDLAAFFDDFKISESEELSDYVDLVYVENGHDVICPRAGNPFNYTNNVENAGCTDSWFFFSLNDPRRNPAFEFFASALRQDYAGGYNLRETAPQQFANIVSCPQCIHGNGTYFLDINGTNFLFNTAQRDACYALCGITRSEVEPFGGVADFTPTERQFPIGGGVYQVSGMSSRKLEPEEEAFWTNGRITPAGITPELIVIAKMPYLLSEARNLTGMEIYTDWGEFPVDNRTGPAKRIFFTQLTVPHESVPYMSSAGFHFVWGDSLSYSDFTTLVLTHVDDYASTGSPMTQLFVGGQNFQAHTPSGGTTQWNFDYFANEFIVPLANTQNPKSSYLHAFTYSDQYVRIVEKKIGDMLFRTPDPLFV